MADFQRAHSTKVTKPDVPHRYLSWVGQKDPLHIARARKEAAAEYQKAELPTRVGHVWKHVNPAVFVPDVNELPPDNRFMESHERGDRNEVQFLVGSDLFVSLTDEAVTKGVQVGDLSDASARIGTVVSVKDGFFEAMNQWLWSSGIYLRVPAGVRLADPISLRINTDARYPFVRIFVHVEDGASATILEHISSSSQHGATVMIAEVDVGENAVLHHGVMYGQDAPDVLHYSHGASIRENGTMRLIAATSGNGRLKADFSGRLAGRRAHSDIRTFAMVDDRTRIDFHTRQHHIAPQSTSDMKSRSVLLDRAVSSNTGLIRIEESARDCEAYQIARNLMLSKRAEATAIPELEIENNDVVCSHGAATGTLDKEQLFYLMSRGLSKAEAIQLIVEGTLHELLSGFSPDVAQFIEEAHEPLWEKLSARQE
ncbi:MAG: Fe-S cluster assembly protein SufD [Deltaproteobacteria bacterium]|nr:Fe-S cluster assembly protein SufD [Deltaproteobacteria bacterium]MBN2671080.1 Fe-S cluster assembly protein SufD [Deltaproteobacteria bacterium]